LVISRDSKKIESYKSNRLKNYMRKHWILYAMLVLPVAYFFIFSYVPLVNVLLAFKQNNVVARVWDVPWVGFDNFVHIFSLQIFRDAIRNTLMFSFLDLVIGFPAPIILALLLNELKLPRFKKITQTISYMPFFLSWVIVGGLSVSLFSTSTGTINAIIINMGFDPIPFLNNPRYWVFTNVLLSVWRSVGWNTIIYLAAITNVNPELYEAADMDGASRIRKMWHVTLPSIRPVIIILLILTLGQIMGADLARFISLENLIVRSVSEVLPTFVFRWGLQSMQFSIAAAVGIFQSLIGMVLLLSANFAVKKLGGQGFW